jgi:hypothetical protein
MMKRFGSCLAIVLALLVLAPRSASATTWYVSTLGSNANSCNTASTTGSTTETSAKLNIRDAIDCLRTLGGPGDSVMLYGGHVYSGARDVIDSQVYTIPSGSSTGWGTTNAGAVTIGCKAGSGTCVLKPADFTALIRFSLNPALDTYQTISYLVIQDLELDLSNQGTSNFDPDTDGDKAAAIYVSCCSHHLRFQRLNIHHSATHAIQFSTNGDTDGRYDAYIELRDSLIHDFGTATLGGGHSGGNPGVNNGYGIYTFSSWNVLYGNEFYNGHGIGMNVYGDNVTVWANRVHDNGTTRTCAMACTVFGFDYCSSSYYDPSNGYAPWPCTAGLIKNNLIYRNAGGAQIYFGATGTKFENNTVYANDHAYNGIGLHLQGCATPAIRNNIILSNTQNYVNDSSGTCVPTCDHNLVPVNPTGCTSGQTGAPTFADGLTGHSETSFHLAVGSVGIDQGATLAEVTDDFDGDPRTGAYDIGADELDGTVIVTPPPASTGVPMRLRIRRAA